MLIVENSKEIKKICRKIILMEEKNDAMDSLLEPFNVMIESVSPFKLKKFQYSKNFKKINGRI